MSLLTKLKRARIANLERFTPFVTTYLGFRCYTLDKWAFLHMCEEIFFREIYSFKSGTDTPFIIDCGANIGLATIYFKRKYPRATILAFEPDPLAVDAFKKNTRDLAGIELIEKALSDKLQEISFHSDHADGGRRVINNDDTTFLVKTAVLSTYLDKKVDFLKIDIEGAEMEVIEECKDQLVNVERMFIEFHSVKGRDQSFHKLLQILSNAGFKYYIECSGIKSRNPFLKIEGRYDYDMLINIFCYR